jgi:hypothetical protein
MVFRGLPRACWEFFFFKKELGSVTLKTNNQHTLVCVCGTPKRTNSIPASRPLWFARPYPRVGQTHFF